MNSYGLEEIKKKSLPILREAGITRAGVFGSFVRGDEKKGSDIDILVDFPKASSLFDVVELKYKLEDKLGRPVDVVNYKTIKPKLKSHILTEQITIL